MYLTYSDIIDYVSRIVYSYGASAGVSASRDQIRAAISSSYAAIAVKADWRRYQAFVRFNVNNMFTAQAEYTGTTLVLSSGEWPVWCERCTVRISSGSCRIDKRSSNTVVTLESEAPLPVQPGVYTVTVFHDAHKLPGDFLFVNGAFLGTQGCELRPTTHVNAWRMYGRHITGAFPTHFIVETGAKNYVRLVPPPTGLISVDVFYRRRSRPLVHSGRDEVNSAGKVSVNGTSVTGTDTTFRQDMVGCVLRIGTETDMPTDLDGFYPYQEERLITAVNSATSLTVDSPFDVNHANVMYSVTSQLDIDQHMYDYLVALSVERLSQMLGKQIPVDVEETFKRALSAEMSLGQPSPLVPRNSLVYSGRIGSG